MDCLNSEAMTPTGSYYPREPYVLMLLQTAILITAGTAHQGIHIHVEQHEI